MLKWYEDNDEANNGDGEDTMASCKMTPMPMMVTVTLANTEQRHWMAATRLLADKGAGASRCS